MESDGSNSNSSSTVNLPDSFKDPQLSRVWRPHACYQISNLLRYKTFSQKIRKRRKLLRYKPRMQKVPDYNHPMPVHASSTASLSKVPISKWSTCDEKMSSITSHRFQKREITTIHEEVFQYNKHSFRKPFSKSKGYKEKVASLKVIVGRLQKMCLEKPEVLQSNIPEETITLFKKIHL